MSDLSRLSDDQLVSQLVKNSIRKSHLVDQIVDLDASDEFKISLIKSLTTAEKIELVSDTVESMGVSPGDRKTETLLGSIRCELVSSGSGTTHRGMPELATSVYFIESKSGLIKIGRSNRPHARFKAIKSMSPEELTLLGTIPESVVTESQLHKKFAHLRQHGEWFSDSPELRDFIEKNVGQ